MEREYFYEESTGTSSGTGGGVDKVTLVESATDGDVWFHIATCSANQADGTAYEITLLDTESDLLSHHIVPKASTDYFSCPILAVDTAFGSTIQAILSLINDGAPSFTGYNIREASIMTIKAHELDQYVDGSAISDTASSTSYESVGTALTFTPANAGDYLILAYASVTKDTTASNFNVKLVISGSDFCDATMRAISTTRYMPYFCHKVVSLTAASHTIEFQAKVTTGGTATILNPTIIALRLDTFPWYQTTESISESTSTSSTYQTPINPTIRAQNKPYWLLSSCLGRRGAASNSHYQRTLYDATTLQETLNQPQVASGENCHFAQSVVTPSTGDHTMSGQYKTDGAGITVAGKSESVITAILLEDDATVRIRGGSIFGAKICN